jgi:hypothetical protein
MTRAVDVLRTIDLIEDHVAMGAGALVRARHRAAASLPGNAWELHFLLGEATTALHGDTDRPKNRARRKAQRQARRTRRQA